MASSPSRCGATSRSSRFRLADSPWAAADVNEIIMASAFDVTGLPTHNYQYGLGVPLIAVCRSKGSAGAREVLSPRDGLPAHGFPGKMPSKLKA